MSGAGSGQPPRRQRTQLVLLAASGLLALAVLLVDELSAAGSRSVTGAVAAAVLLAAVAAAALLLARDAARRGARAERAVRVDELTDLPNRRALLAALAAALQPAPGEAEEEAEESLVALLLVDLDRFKELNDRYGHGVGDALLRRIARYVPECLPDGALLARPGGDEFAVLLTGEGAAMARLVADQVAAAVAVASPDDVEGWTTTASIGIAYADGPEDQAEPVEPAAAAAAGVVAAQELLRRAEVAMYLAKSTGGGVQPFDSAYDGAALERALLADELRVALAEPDSEDGPGRGATAQLVVFYQPQVGVASGVVGGLEALVRWRHPRHGLVGPEVFLEIAEEQGLVDDLTRRVLRAALADARSWHDDGHRVRVAVNVSASCLTSPALLPMVDAALEESGVDPALLVLEVTETILMAKPHQALATARRLRERGTELSIDDYGTGFSSLSYLSDLPATEMKLDRAFTSRMLTDTTTAAIIASTVDLAHRLGLRLIVEGVEDAETLAALTAMGCDETQGYLHSRPEPASAVRRWLAGGAPGRTPAAEPGLPRAAELAAGA